LFVGDWAISQVWLFILIPIIGAALAGMVYNYLKAE
jgi:aquaporin Z